MSVGLGGKWKQAQRKKKKTSPSPSQSEVLRVLGAHPLFNCIPAMDPVAITLDVIFWKLFKF